jgi:hypothetical protein
MPRRFLISTSPPSIPNNSVTPSNHPHDHDTPDNSFIRESTPDLAQAIMLMTHELRLRDSPEIPTPMMKKPDTFDGSEPHKLNNFILLCNLYFRRNSAFSDDEDKATFALSHLRGTALELFEPAILDSSETPDWFNDWSAFVRTLRTHFGPLDPAANAENDIDNLKMSENHHIVEYNVKFNRLAIQTGWDDSVLRHRYYSGLAERIKDIMGQQGKPSTLSAMKNLAHSIDARHWERFREKSRSENPTPHSSIDLHTEPDPPTSSKHNSTPPEFSDMLRNPFTISDILGKDGKLTTQERQRRFDNNLCLFCGGTGHMVNACPKSLAKAFAAKAMEDSDSGNSDPENSDSENSALENSEHEKSESESSDLEYSNPGNSELENSESENSGSSESADSGSEDSE